MFDVTSPASAKQLVTLEGVKGDLGITSADDDAFLTRCLDRLSDFVCGYIRVRQANDGSRTLARETLVETFRPGRPTPALILARLPVTAIASVLEDETTLEAADYELHGSAGILTRLFGDRPGCWSTRKIVVTYTAGWVMPGQDGRTLPFDLEGAAVILVKAARFNRTRDPQLRSENILEQLYSYSLFAPSDAVGGVTAADVVAVLERYRQLIVA